MDIKGKVAVVTGASKGIGKAIAEALAREGAKVVAAARSSDAIEAFAKDHAEALAVPTDMRKPDDVKRLVQKTLERYGRIDLFVNNAGQGMTGPVETADINEYKEIMELNVYAVLRAMQAVIPVMRKQGGGMIVNVSSRVSKNHFPGLGAYASTKYALNALSLTARQELEKDTIVVSVIHPKMTATDFGANSLGVKIDWSARAGTMPEVDTADQVAEKTVELIRSEAPEAEM